MCACCAQLRERWQPPTDDPEWRNLALAKGLVPSLLSQAAARAAEPLAHITRTLVQLEVIDHDVGQTALSNYLKNCLAKSKGISGPSYNPANGSHTLHRHIAAAVPVASLLKVRGKELLSALHRTREEPEAAYGEQLAQAQQAAKVCVLCICSYPLDLEQQAHTRQARELSLGLP